MSLMHQVPFVNSGGNRVRDFIAPNPACERCKLISLDTPGERIVEDDVVERKYQQYPLMIAVHQRIATDPNDQGELWSSRRVIIDSR